MTIAVGKWNTGGAGSCNNHALRGQGECGDHGLPGMLTGHQNRARALQYTLLRYVETLLLLRLEPRLQLQWMMAQRDNPQTLRLCGCQLVKRTESQAVDDHDRIVLQGG